MGYDLVSVSVPVFESAQIVLQVYRDKNLRFNLDLRTPSLSSLYFNLDLRNLRALRVYALTSISAPRAFRESISAIRPAVTFFLSPLFYPFAFGFI